jgi:hypothetical protein
MRMIYGAAVLLAGLTLAGSALSQGLPSDVEDKLRVRKNASPAEVERALSDLHRSGRRLSPDTEQKVRAWLRQRSDGDDRRAGSSDRRSDGPRRRLDDDDDVNGGDRVARCERRAERHGLDGNEFARFVRSCIQR